jgi:RNA polymerase sigma-70 factor (ECF subfamily)
MRNNSTAKPLDMVLVTLVERARKGDEIAFEEIVRLKSRDMLFFAISILGSKEDAEDVAREALISMWKSIGHIRKPESFNAWMFQIVKRTAWRHASRKKFDTIEIDDVTLMGKNISEEKEEFIPDEYLLSKERSEEIYNMVLSLPPKRREAVLMHYYMDMSITEIASASGQTEATIRGVLGKARNAIKSKILEAGAAYGAVLMSKTNLRQILHNVPGNVVSSDMCETLTQNVHVLIAGITPVVLSANKIVAVIIACTLAGAAVTGSLVFRNTNTDRTEPNSTDLNVEEQINSPVVAIAPERIRTNFGGDCKCGHINPYIAVLDTGTEPVHSTDWTIWNKDGKALCSGSGTDAMSGIALLENEENYGTYELEFNVLYTNGYTARVCREFDIVSASEFAKMAPETAI